MKPVTLHIGAPKTGSTYLQRWLEENHDLLATRGFHTMPLAMSHRVAVECIVNPARREADDIIRLLETPLDTALQKLAEGMQRSSVCRYVISSEYFVNADVARVADFFKRNGLVVDSIICFVRRQDRVVASGINQWIKVEGRSQIPKSFRFNRAQDWHDLYHRWRDIFPGAKIIFRHYDLHARNNALLDVFKQDIGYVGDGEEDRLPTPEQSNPSLNKTLLEVSRLANERGHKDLGPFLIKAQLDGFDGQRFGLSQDKVRQLEKLYLECNQALARALGAEELAELAEPGWRSEGSDLDGQVAPETLVDLLARAVSRLPVSETRIVYSPPVSADPDPHTMPAQPVDAGEPQVNGTEQKQPGGLLRGLLARMLLPVFDTAFYLSTYRDVDASGTNPYLHYLLHGRREGRMRKPGSLVFQGNADRLDSAKETILIVLHEGTRTGAPIIGYNLVLGLLAKYHVVVLALSPGPVAEACHAAGAFVAVSRGRAATWLSGDSFIRQLTRRFSFSFALVNGFGSRFVLRKLRSLHIPVVMLVHEFAGNIRPLSDLVKIVDLSFATVFPSSITRENALQLLPVLRGRHFPVIPQGRCVLPPDVDRRGRIRGEEHPDEVRKALGLDELPEGVAVLMAAGSVNYRKGTDLFIQCAARFAQLFPDVPAHFVWVGDAYQPASDGAYSAYLADQIHREDLEGRVHFAGEIANMSEVYPLADLLLLTSRLDPLPNVCIEAMAAGVPMLCFDKATGFVDILNERELGPDCVARYMDVEDLARKAGALVRSPKRRVEIAEIGRNIAGTFSMPEYVRRIEELALRAAHARPGTHGSL